MPQREFLPLRAREAQDGVPRSGLKTTRLRRVTPPSSSPYMYVVPPNVSALMVDVIDGKLPQVRRRLAAMSPADAKHWRQTALLTATWAGHASLVDALLDHGAAVDGKAWTPPLKSRFYKATANAMKHRRQRLGPALPVAAGCGDAATLRVLLHHHAAVNQTNHLHHRGVDALFFAVMTGDADSVRVLLDHGANPCGDDRWMLAIHTKQERPHAGHTKASLTV